VKDLVDGLSPLPPVFPMPPPLPLFSSPEASLSTPADPPRCRLCLIRSSWPTINIGRRRGGGNWLGERRLGTSKRERQGWIGGGGEGAGGGGAAMEVGRLGRNGRQGLGRGDGFVPRSRFSPQSKGKGTQTSRR
jgi:hypothetical protein